VSRPAGVVAGAGGKLAGDVVSRLVQFALVYYAQVSLGPAAYGTLVYGLAVGLVCAHLADMGLQLSVTRVMAGDAAGAGAVARTGLRLKVRLAAGVTLLLGLIALAQSPGLRLATWLAAMTMVAATFVEYAGYAFRGLHRILDDARLAVGLRVVTAAVGGVVLWRHPDVTAFAMSQVIATAAVASAAIWWLLRELPSGSHAPVPSGRKLMTDAGPLGAAIVLSTLFTRTPTFVLAAAAGPAAVGAFGVAQRLVEPLAMIPSAMLASVFPALVREQQRDARRARLLKVRTGAGLLGLGIIIAACSTMIGPLVTDRFYGAPYAAAVRPLQWLGAGLVLTYTNYALTHFLIAHERQRALMGLNALVLVTCLVVCAALVPSQGPTGAAFGLLAGECLLTAGCAIVLLRARHRPTGASASAATESLS
jgi:O-antigen/teichoic acid export membrane protein